MKIQHLKFLLAAAVGAAALGCAAPTQVKDVQEKHVEQLDIKASAGSKPIQLSKVVVRLKRGEQVGTLQGGLLCIPQTTLTWKGGRLKLDSDDLTDAFKEELEKYSFKTVGDTSALFEDPSSWKSEILVAGLVKELKSNVCLPLSGLGDFSTAKGEAFVKVEWQIYSKLDRAVVHSVTTEGSFKATEVQKGGTLDTIIINAFTQAARHLLADQRFRDIVVRGGQTVNETTFKTATGFVITPGRAQPFGSRPEEWKDGVATVFAGQGHGSAFAIGENLLMTNHHVVGESNNVVVKLGSGFEVKGEVIAYNSALDVAVVKVPVAMPRFFKLQRQVPTIGSDVFALGTPLSETLGATLSRGVVSAIRTEDGKKLIQSDVNVLPGNSGGPLVDKSGEAVAITVSGIQINKAPQGINFFVPIAEALASMGLQ